VSSIILPAEAARRGRKLEVNVTIDPLRAGILVDAEGTFDSQPAATSSGRLSRGTQLPETADLAVLQ
jgi:hypothetical protein